MPFIRLLSAIIGIAFLLLGAASAMVGGAQPSAEGAGRSVVMIVGSRGTSCTATAIARDILLTAGHCVLPGAEYKLVDYDTAHQPVLKDVTAIARHPQFDLKRLFGHLATADVALLKLAAPIPAKTPAVPIGSAGERVAVGDAFIVAGYGVTVRGDGHSGGTVRAATLIATGKPGTLQIRLFDPATRGASPGLGACTGDSGAPVFRDTAGRLAVIGVVSWSTGPNLGEGCGGLTGVTPLGLYREWLVEEVKKMGTVLGP